MTLFQRFYNGSCNYAKNWCTGDCMSMISSAKTAARFDAPFPIIITLPETVLGGSLTAWPQKQQTAWDSASGCNHSIYQKTLS